ncbi:MAG: hypothetical protein JWM13_698 [Arthrobacter sp.]|nr:hypothetical protein [Arthrobacter sp.]
MCGACGSAVVPDPVLGAVRTLRQHLIVAQTVNTVCGGLPGAPKVKALTDGWLLSGPSGASLLCHTVEDLWTAVIRGLAPGSQLDALLEHQQAFAAGADGAGLPARAVAVGRGLAAAAQAPSSRRDNRREISPGHVSLAPTGASPNADLLPSTR